jgi:hypothetical protein
MLIGAYCWPFNNFLKKLSCMFIFTFLNQNIDFITILVDSLPKAMQRTIDLDEYLIKIPSITQLPSALPDLTTIPLPKFITPISDSFVTDGNASFCQQFFDVTEAKCKSVIKPHSVTYYLRWIAISGINISIFYFQIIAFL